MTIKVLGQIALAATTETDLYTVPSGSTAVGSSLVVCNRGSSVTSFRISVSVGGGATANKDYLYYDVLLPPNDTFVATVGLTLAETDVVRGYAGNSNVSMSLFGEEV
jgi:ribulose 1,5-bisphosphate synthetase/thiazole synthase